MNTLSKIASLSLALGALALPAQLQAVNLAGVAGSSGSIEQIAVPGVGTPLDLDNNAYQSDTKIRLLYQGQETLGADLDVYSGFDGSGDPVQDVTIGAGATVRSYLLHWDPTADGSGIVNFTDTWVDFQGEILGYLGWPGELDATDDIGHLSNRYAFSGLKGDIGRQAGFGRSNDNFTLGGGQKGDNYGEVPTDRFQVYKLSINGSNVDQIRIFTVVPEPSTIIAMILGLGVIAYRGLRRKTTSTIPANA